MVIRVKLQELDDFNFYQFFNSHNEKYDNWKIQIEF